jgi:outer membrane receptor protein involved in Fe transport
VGQVPVIPDPRIPNPDCRVTTLPNGTQVGTGLNCLGGTFYPVDTVGAPGQSFENTGTSQPKVDGRLDQEFANGGRMTYQAGLAGSEGIVHTGIGPFDLQSGSVMWYGRLAYSQGALRVAAFGNFLDAEAPNLLLIDPATRQPVQLNFKTQTYDFELGHSKVVAGHHILSYGGNVRRNQFKISLTPNAEDRTELGGYVQDEIFYDKFRLTLGGRVDKFGNIDDPVFSPRVSLMFKPAPSHSIRASYNQAFRSPSLINNFLEVTIVDQLDLARVNPAFAGLPGRNFVFPIGAVGHEDLTEESIQAFEVGYTANVRNRATLSAAVYWTRNEDEIFFTQTGRYRATSPPPGWLQTFAPGGFPVVPPQVALGILEALPPPCPSLATPCTTGGLPSEFSYRNLGVNRNKGFELGIDAAATQAVNIFTHYSFQAKPDPDFADEETNRPPRHRFNAGFNFSQGRFLGNASVSFVDDAFFQDVLDARFNGTTEAYTQVNGAFGVRWMDGKVSTSIKAINLTNEDIQSHVFGDVIKRQVIGELRFQF